MRKLMEITLNKVYKVQRNTHKMLKEIK